MAYTYDDFTKAATAAGVLNSFDQNDLDYAKKYPEFGLSMVSLQRDLGNAKTDEQKLLASEAINQLRKNYGSYWTGDSGNRSYAASYGSKINDTMDKIGSYGDFKYTGQDDYKKLLDSVVNQKSFKYDPSTDPLFSDYKKAYLREGDRAAQNALAQSAMATGGIPSSYAQTAAQQAANYYAGKLADSIPALRAQALEEYNNKFSQLLQKLSAMDTDRSTEYQTYTDKYNMLKDALSMYQGQDDSDYKRYLDMINAEYQRDRDAVTDAQQELANALQIYQLTGKITGPLVDIMGTAAAPSTGGGGGGYSGGDGTTKTTPKTATPASSGGAQTATQKLSAAIDKTLAQTDGKVQNPVANTVSDLVRTTVAKAAQNAAASKSSGQTASLYGVNNASTKTAQQQAQSGRNAASAATQKSGSNAAKSTANIKALGAR